MAQTKKFLSDKFIVDGGTSSGFLKADGTIDTTSYGTGSSNFSGDYNDLTNQPTIPSATSDLTNDSGFLSSTTGNWTGTFDGQEGTYYLNYNNFSNTPTIPSGNQIIDWTAASQGTIDITNLPATALTSVQVAANQTAMLALTTQEGDVVVRSDENKTYMHNGGTAGTMADFTELSSPTDAVTSVNGLTGAVTITVPTDVSDLTQDIDYLRADQNDTMTGALTLGDGTGQTNLHIKKADNNVPDQIVFYNGTTRVGEIGASDDTWLRLNGVTNKNIYTSRYIRADNGFFVDSTSKGIDGSGNFIGGTITGASDANVSNWDTAFGWGDHSAEGYIDSTTGNWTGTFDGQEGTYYLDYNNFTNTPSSLPPSSHTLDSHSNVTITSIGSGELLKWSGSAWVNNTLAEAGIATVASVPTATSDLTNDSGFITDGNTNWNNSYGFITASSTDTLTNKSGNISQWTNNSGYISDYTVTEGDVTAHEGALTITESQISDLSHFSGAWADITGKPSTFTPAAHTLDSHSNVTITSNSSGEILKWNGSAWVNNTLAEAGIASTASIPTATSDLTNDSGFISSTSGNWSGTFDGQEGTYYLAYGNLTGVPSTFAPSAHALGSHSDVTITSVGSGEILKWSGSAWINNTLAEAGIASTASIPTATSDLTNDSGFITDGNTNWNNSYGFITASSTDTLTNKSGNISQWTNDSGYSTFDGAYSSLTGIPSTFTPSGHTLDSHSNVTITSNSSGEILKWNGSAWINNTLAEAGIASTASIPTATSDLTNDSSFVNGSGATNRVAFWSDGDTLSSDSGIYVAAATDDIFAAGLYGSPDPNTGISFPGTDTMRLETGGGLRLFIADTIVRSYVDFRTDGDLTIDGGIQAGGGFGTSGQILSSTGTGINWIDAPSGGGGGTIDGTGVANKIAFFTDSDTIDDTTLHWDSANGRLGIGDTSPSYPLDVNVESSFGGGTLHYDHTNKRIGIYTSSPSERLDVNGTLRLRGAVKDGGNSAGSAGQVLVSTGSAVDWVSGETLDYVNNFMLYDSVKLGSSGTVYFDWAGGGSQNSLGYTNLMIMPEPGELFTIQAISSATLTGCTFSLVNQSGTQLWTSGSLTLTANTVNTMTVSSPTAWSAGDQVSVKLVRSNSAGSNATIGVTAGLLFQP